MSPPPPGPSDPQAYIDLEELVEPIVQAFKDELEEIKDFDTINEGELGYQNGIEAWVVPGQMRPEISSTTSLKWRATIYVIVSNSEKDATLPDLRKIAFKAFNQLAKDPTHGGTAWATFPRLFHPGFMTDGQRTFVGVLMVYEVDFYQKYINNSS